MGRHSNSTALTTGGPPLPDSGAAGKAQSRRAASPSRTKQVAAPVSGRTAQRVMGIGGAQSPPSSHRGSASPSKAVAGKATPGRDHAVATGTTFVKGKASTKPPSPKGAANHPASGKKQFLACAGTHSSIESVVFGADSNPTHDSRDFAAAAGNPSSAAEHSGLFADGHASRSSAAFGARSTADSLIFNRDVDQSEGMADPREHMFQAPPGHAPRPLRSPRP